MRNRNRYPAEWHSTIRPAALAAAKFRCSDCGIKQRSYGYYDLNGHFIESDQFIAKWALKNGFKPHFVYLQVCHLNHNPQDCSEQNLSVKCPKCHFKHDKDFRAMVKKGLPDPG